MDAVIEQNANQTLATPMEPARMSRTKTRFAPKNKHLGDKSSMHASISQKTIPTRDFWKNFAIKHLFGAVVFGVVGGNGSGETHVSQQLIDLLSLVHQHTFR